MKILKIIIPACLLLTTPFVKAQQRVALQSSGTTSIYSSTDPFIAAYTDAISGDTIYLSGGAFTAPATIDKDITIFGAGFHLDSTTATYPTIISNNITIGGNADNLYMEGMELQTITHYSQDTTNNVSFVRCRIGAINADYQYPGESNGWFLLQNVIVGNVELSAVISSLVSHNILTGRIINSKTNLFSNNLIKNQGSYSAYTFTSLQNNTIVNNVISHTGSYFSTSLSGNIWENNVFAENNPPLGVPVIDNNNYKNIDLTTVFVNQTGNTFDYSHDYHLQTAAQTLYPGNDSTEVGIYGGTFPFKDGAVPQNPHISSKTIAPLTTANGDLNIQIQVIAQ
ncbi:MAG: hypothetical protein R3279_08890 [Putridiphycobacter sp.]|nr:hypothetical protein [Putridiphycobacter sp.]